MKREDGRDLEQEVAVRTARFCMERVYVQVAAALEDGSLEAKKVVAYICVNSFPKYLSSDYTTFLPVRGRVNIR